jgi:DNA modification methylase
MPTLTWATKANLTPPPASLEMDSIVYPHGSGYPAVDPENQLILGDNLEVMSALLAEYEGRINLIYADPPFFSNRQYPVRIGRGEDSRRPQEWQLAQGYPDRWPDMDSYLDMLYPRLLLMYRLLAPDGTLYLHLDWHANAYARLLLDEIFGSDRLLNELIWVYHGPSPIRSAFNRKHDTILVYTKSDKYTFNVNAVRQPYDPTTLKTFASSPKAGFGKIPDLKRGKVPEDWWYFPVIARLHRERSGYPTQKPEALLERILLASSNPGDWVADFFCGSGTTPVLASRLGRRFIASDVTFRALHTTRNRLLNAGPQVFGIHRVKGFESSETRGNLSASLKLHQEGNTLVLEATHPDEIDYWEVDPRWDGHIFHSVAQAIRSRKKETINLRITLPEEVESDRILARVVDIHGETALLTA